MFNEYLLYGSHCGKSFSFNIYSIFPQTLWNKYIIIPILEMRNLKMKKED